jgi:hypothetical protein
MRVGPNDETVVETTRMHTCSVFKATAAAATAFVLHSSRAAVNSAASARAALRSWIPVSKEDRWVGRVCGRCGGQSPEALTHLMSSDSEQASQR